MLKHYLISAIRNLGRQKIFSLINISGLAIGVSAALVIYLIVQFEFSYEKFRNNNDRIYRVVTDMTFPGGSESKNSGVPMPMPKAVRTDLTGIELATQFLTPYQIKVNIPVANSSMPLIFKKEKEIVFADEFYFDLFKYDWLSGSKQTALNNPFQVVLTEDRAKAYFGNLAANEIIGKQIIYNDSIKTTVTGIIKTPKEKATDFRFKEFISLKTVTTTSLKNQFSSDSWGSVSSSTQLFVQLKKGTTPQQVNAQFAGLRKKYNTDQDIEEDNTKNHLQALTDIHFNADYDAFDQRQAHKPTLYGLLAVATFLLLLGCINFINLTTAQSAQRAKEIGIRKTLGSGKKNLIFQFLSETFLLTLLATILSILITPWLLNIFSGFIPPEINFSSINQFHVWMFLAVLVLLMTIISGFYPALVLTKFKPITVLKNQVSTVTKQNRTAWLRKSLTVTQFIIAQFLVIATLVVGKQINFSLNKDLGFKKDAIVSFNTATNNYSRKEDNRRFALMEKIKAIPGIEKIALGGEPPSHEMTGSGSMTINNGKKDVTLMVETMLADPAYFDVYNMKLVAGNFPVQSDTTKEYLINETYARAAGFANPADAVGKFVARNKNIPIVGVLADFNTKSTHEAIKPLAYSSERLSSFKIHLALKPQTETPGLWKALMEKVEKEYKSIYPDDDFKYDFFDETVAAFYKSEQDIARLLNWASGLCIFISCLGLLGLVIYTTNTRTKEIGVRKVLGASVTQIVTLLSKDLISLVLIAFIIASPLAWLAMNKWLQGFVYRTQISWWVFAACGISMLLLAIVVLGIRTIKAAIANPAKSLRTE